MGPEDLAKVLQFLPRVNDPNLLVGLETGDDAGVYRIAPDLALVQTVDFFSPVVDDPYDFGRIAAANSLSDIYAMGARPLTALNIVCFSAQELPHEVLGAILRGGADKAREAGVTIVGGHTLDDKEPKYGLAVTGLIHPDRVITNAGCKKGDALVLTKPLGVGILTTGIKRGLTPANSTREVVELMATLNRGACEAMQEVGVHAATDITGFGLLGHLSNMLKASGVSAVLSVAQVPVLPETRKLAAKDCVPGGSKRNLKFVEPRLRSGGIDPDTVIILADAQTSGGLLIVVPPDRLEKLLRLLKAQKTPTAALIGEVTAGDPGTIRLS